VDVETRIRPLFALRLRTPRLELRLPVGAELLQLAHLARAGIHPPETMPFRVAWTDGAGEPDFLDQFIAHHDERRASWQPGRWGLNLGVWVEGEPAGSQTIEAEDFEETRTVSTGSWLGQRFQGHGYGTEMRAAVLELAFAGLGARRARSGFIEGTVASQRVSQKLGYEPAGEGIRAPRGVPVRELKFVLTRDQWTRHRTIPVVIDGLEPCLPLFGAAGRSGMNAE
jgi:RimJ/RimL family protein N-acetyltransferase